MRQNLIIFKIDLPMPQTAFGDAADLKGERGSDFAFQYNKESSQIFRNRTFFENERVFAGFSKVKHLTPLFKGPR